MSEVLRRNPKAFERVWASIIEPAIDRYCTEAAVTCRSLPEAKQSIRIAYNHFNKQCSERYMSDRNKPLNQRKIAACYVQAIVLVRPLLIDYWDSRCIEAPLVGGRVAYESRPCFANERLAIHVACSVLVSFLKKAVHDSRSSMTPEEMGEADAYLKRGVDLLREVDGGEFVLNLERSLSFMSLESNFNTPLLACLFSYWEAKILPPELYRKALIVFALESEGDHIEE